jgi:hypothetical protein
MMPPTAVELLADVRAAERAVAARHRPVDASSDGPSPALRVATLPKRLATALAVIARGRLGTGASSPAASTG